MTPDSQIDDAVTDTESLDCDLPTDSPACAREDDLDGLKPWKRTFITQLRTVPNVGLACRTANVSRQTAYEYRKNDARFAALWDSAMEDAADEVEGSLYEEAAVGRQKVIYGKDGEVKSVEHVKDVNAMRFFLQGNRPTKYRESAAVVNVNLAPAEDAVARALANGALARFARELAEEQGKIIDVEAVTAPAK